MGIRETLQQALEAANNERLSYHSALQQHDTRLLDLRADLARARSRRDGAEQIKATAIKDHHDLMAHCNRQLDQAAKSALGPQLRQLMEEERIAVRNVGIAVDMVRQFEGSLSTAETQRAVDQTNFNSANERWEQIRKQLDELNQ